MRRYEERAKVHTPVPGVAVSISVVVIGLLFLLFLKSLKAVELSYQQGLFYDSYSEPFFIMVLTITLTPLPVIYLLDKTYVSETFKAILSISASFLALILLVTMFTPSTASLFEARKDFVEDKGYSDVIGYTEFSSFKAFKQQAGEEANEYETYYGKKDGYHYQITVKQDKQNNLKVESAQKVNEPNTKFK